VGLTPRRLPAAVAAFALLVSACSGTVAGPQTQSNSTSVVLLSGTAQIEAAQSFDDPGFHEVLSVDGAIPDLGDLAGTAGSSIVVSLWDTSRPDQTCNQDHPLSGCITIDWSDSPSRPGVPESGVFNNQIRFAAAGGPVDLYLSESGALATTPDQFTPG